MCKAGVIMTVIKIHGERAGDRCRELESQIRTSGCHVEFGDLTDLQIYEGKRPAGDCTLTADQDGNELTYLSRGKITIAANRSDQATTLLY
jgi:hypothetical protein